MAGLWLVICDRHGIALACAFAFDTLLRREKQSFRPPSEGELLSLCVAKEKDNQRERPPRLALAGLLPGKSVSRGRAFRTGILPVRKGIDIPVDARCAAFRPRLTAAQGPRVEQRAILARTLQKNEIKNESNSTATLRPAFAPGPGFCLQALSRSAGQHGPLLYPGPLCSGGRVEDQPAG